MKIGKILIRYSVFVLLAVLFATNIGAATNKNKYSQNSDVSGTDLKISAKDYFLGDKKADIVIVEYASLTCSHCADFHSEVISYLRNEFIKKGKLLYVYRDFPLDRLALAASMIARCTGRKNFFGFLETLYLTQSKWMNSEKPLLSLEKLSRLAGLKKEQYNICLQNSNLRDQILAQRLEAAKEFKVKSTPTIFINGELYSGEMNLSQLRAFLNNIQSK